MHLRRTVAALVITVPDIIDTNPNRKERVGARPRRRGRLGRDRRQELIDLVSDTQDSRLVRSDKVRVNGGPAVGIVVCV